MLVSNEDQLIQKELTDVVKIVTSITERLDRRQAHESTDRRTKEVLQDRIISLEADVAKLQEENIRLKVANGEQAAKLDDLTDWNGLQALEIVKLINERDEVSERLGKVENLFKGIFPGEKQATSSASISSSRRDSLGDVKGKCKQTDKSISWSPTTTQISSSSTQVYSRTSSPSPSILSRSTDMIVKARSTGSSVHSSPIQGRPSSRGGRAHGIQFEHTEDFQRREWYIEMNEPPATASSAKGPYVLTDLAGRLGMTTGEVRKLEEVIRSSRLGPRIHIFKNCVFLFDPMWLELTEHTCLIDWSEKEVADEIKEYVRRKTKTSVVLQMFSYPLHKEGWFYMGAHTLQCADLLEVWPQLQVEEKQKIAEKVRDRRQRGGAVGRNEEEIVDIGESDRLKQTTIEVWMAGGESSMGFVEKHGL